MQYPKLDKVIDDFIDRIRYAVASDLVRWPGNYTGPIDDRKQLMKLYLSEKVAFLVSEWGEGIINGISSPVMTQDNDLYWYTLEGRRLNAQPSTPGLYIHGKKKVVIR